MAHKDMREVLIEGHILYDDLMTRMEHQEGEPQEEEPQEEEPQEELQQPQPDSVHMSCRYEAFVVCLGLLLLCIGAFYALM